MILDKGNPCENGVKESQSTERRKKTILWLKKMILDKGKPCENGVNNANHHNQLKVGKKQFYD